MATTSKEKTMLSLSIKSDAAKRNSIEASAKEDLSIIAIFKYLVGAQAEEHPELATIVSQSLAKQPVLAKMISEHLENGLEKFIEEHLSTTAYSSWREALQGTFLKWIHYQFMEIRKDEFVLIDASLARDYPNYHRSPAFVNGRVTGEKTVAKLIGQAKTKEYFEKYDKSKDRKVVKADSLNDDELTALNEVRKARGLPPIEKPKAV